MILEWDPAREWVPIDRESPDSNPRYLVNTIDLESRHINRPADIMAHPDGLYVILAGIPYRGDTGGGLTLWNRETETDEVLTDRDLIPDQSTTTMLALPEGKLLCGTTVTPLTGRREEGRGRRVVHSRPGDKTSRVARGAAARGGAVQ